MQDRALNPLELAESCAMDLHISYSNCAGCLQLRQYGETPRYKTEHVFHCLLCHVEIPLDQVYNDKETNS